MRKFDHERDDDRGDDRYPRKRSRVDVNLTEALVASVAAQAPDRLAAATEQQQSAERAHDAERDQSTAGIATEAIRVAHEGYDLLLSST